MKIKGIVKQILKEELDDFTWVQNIKQFSPAEEFIYEIMSNLKAVPSKHPGLMLYKDESGLNLMVDNINTNTKISELWVNYDEIWLKLRQEFGLNEEEISDLCVRTLEMVHKRKVFTTFTHHKFDTKMLT